MMAVASAAAPAAAAAAFPPPAGDPAGIALARAANAYYSAPARLVVQTLTLFANVTVRTRFVLVKGRTRAVVATNEPPGDGEVSIVDSRGYFAREHGKRCWVRYGPGDPSDSPLINLRGSTFHPPERFGAMTRLTVLERIRGATRHLWVSYTIETATNRIVRQEFYDLEVRYRILPGPPRIPDPTPRCA
jgi:hypothetical protein